MVVLAAARWEGTRGHQCETTTDHTCSRSPRFRPAGRVGPGDRTRSEKARLPETVEEAAFGLIFWMALPLLGWRSL